MDMFTSKESIVGFEAKTKMGIYTVASLVTFKPMHNYDTHTFVSLSMGLESLTHARLVVGFPIEKKGLTENDMDSLAVSLINNFARGMLPTLLEEEGIALFTSSDAIKRSMGIKRAQSYDEDLAFEDMKAECSNIKIGLDGSKYRK